MHALFPHLPTKLFSCFQILAVNGKSIINLSYEQSLQILQKTGTTVELTVSQIYKKTVPSMPVATVQPTRTSTVRNITKSVKNSFKFKKDHKYVENANSTANNVQKMNTVQENNQTNVDSFDPANWNGKNGKDKSSNKVRSMPDLPKVQTNEKNAPVN